MAKNSPANAGDMGSISGSGRSHMPQSTLARAELVILHPEQTHDRTEPLLVVIMQFQRALL